MFEELWKWLLEHCQGSYGDLYGIKWLVDARVTVSGGKLTVRLCKRLFCRLLG